MSLSLARNTWFVGEGRSRELFWRLPAGKTDPSAVGVVRKLGCMCGQASSGLCPTHAALDNMRLLQRRFGTELPEDLPLFPSSTGSPLTKALVVDVFEHLARKVGQKTEDDLGRRAYGGHSARVSGAKFYAALGVELWRLAVFARWQSDIVLHYVGDATLDTFSKDCGGLLANKAADSRACSLEQRLVIIEHALRDAQGQEQARLDALAASVPERSAKRVRNRASGRCHQVLLARMNVNASLWTTVCGWSFGCVDHEFIDESEIVLDRWVCSKCFRCVGPCVFVHVPLCTFASH